MGEGGAVAVAPWDKTELELGLGVAPRRWRRSLGLVRQRRSLSWGFVAASSAAVNWWGGEFPARARSLCGPLCFGAVVILAAEPGLGEAKGELKLGFRGDLVGGGQSVGRIPRLR